MKTRIHHHIIYLFLLILGMIYFAACERSGPFEPVTSQPAPPVFLSKSGPGSGGTADSTAQSTLLLVRKREEAENGVSTATIGPEGGVLIHAAHRVVIPAGALADTVTLTFSMPVSDTLMFELGPDGTQFLKPVQVIFNYDHANKSGIDEAAIQIVVWNPQTQTWDSVPSQVDTELNEVSGDTFHFSRYALSKG